MTTITELLQKGEKSINSSESARLDAEILFCDVMQFKRSRIYSHPEQLVPEAKSVLFQSLIEQRQQGHPIAHLTGKREFWSLELTVNKDTLIPRPETELLVETALQMIPENAAFNILDLGTGSGAIAIAIASERPDCKIVATDINKNTLTIAKENAETHRIENIQFYLSDWYKNIPSQSFDLIVSNPPYIRQDDEHLSQGDVRFEPELALVAGADGMQAINMIVENAKHYLASDACLLIEHGYDQKPLVQEAFLKHDFKRVKTFQDLSGQDRITLGYKYG
ncbi:MAG: peptide chain release factor N(5)-glutamine methyltransferase [Gammaproteobacteria bacterium]|nr:MAG: peptide chain release factor N(5)-glutamine methyltransferase [Gammaproteobacteria bacterium]